MTTQPTVWTVVVAAGSGTRFGTAKQYLHLAGVRVVDRSVVVAAQASSGVVVVVPEADVETESARLAADAVVAGGDSRAASVRNGLAAVPDEAEIICVHDAARPLADVAVYQRVIEAVQAGADGAIPVIPVTDTIRHIDGYPINRTDLQAVQTPQAFQADSLRSVHTQAVEATDDASLVTAAGGRVVAVEGHPRNIKITCPDDLVAAAAWLELGQ